jgi:tetratricopeptide (TPR) repeat protein
MLETGNKWLAVLLILLFVVGCGKMPDERLMEKGRRYDDEQNFTEAVSSYEKLARFYPKSHLRPEALYRAGLVYSNAFQEFDRAITLMQNVIDEYPENRYAAQCQFMIGFIHANSTADTAMARAAYTAFLRNYPEHELVPSVEWELEHLGKDIDEIPELKDIDKKQRGDVRE